MFVFFEELHALLHEFSAVHADVGVLLFAQGIHTDTEGTLGSQGSGDFALDLGGGGTHDTGTVDQTVFRGVMFGTDSLEQGFFGAQNL